MKKCCLVIIDGWGEGGKYGNPILDVNPYWMNKLKNEEGYKSLSAHGEDVGLPSGLMGNSEVGHLTIGAGRVIEQDIVRINKSILNGNLIAKIKNNLKYPRKKIHLVGMVSNGGVHSHIDHMKGLIDAFAESSTKVCIHMISDGRDTSPQIFLNFVKETEDYCHLKKCGIIASFAGRYYSMDRANNFDRTKYSFDMMTKGNQLENIIENVKMMYNNGLNDETLLPTLINSDGLIEQGEPIIFFNFRADRMRQLVDIFIRNGNEIYTMTEYDKNFKVNVIFEKENIINTLAEVISKNNLEQLHIAEEEKYAHVTYFLNGGKEMPFPKERRIVIPSPNVDSYDKTPEMSTGTIVKNLINELKNEIPLIVCNIASPDMVGHTGNYEATKIAVAETDKSIGIIYEACIKNNYTLVITSDHGNSEQMKTKDGNICKTHTTNNVPIIVCGHKLIDDNLKSSLADVAPTVLEILGIRIPENMTGKSLICKNTVNN